MVSSPGASPASSTSSSRKPPRENPPSYDTTTPQSSSPSRPVSRQRKSVGQVNENSPLLSPRSESDDEREPLDPPRFSLDDEDPKHDDGQETKSALYLALLTLSLGGLQITWSVELSNGSPYLLSLGLSKSLMAIVWIAGPLSGTLVQPYVGLRSDNCRIPWGKRRPFIVGGGLATALSLLALSWAREIVGGFLSIFGADPTSEGVKVTTIIFAVISLYILDFAINTIQAAIRCYIVDNAPTHQQESANAWAGRMTGIGNILGYIFGYINLPEVMPFLGNTQFKVLCALAALALAITVGVSCATVPERDPRLEGPPPEGSTGVISFFTQMFRSILRLPPQIRKVCEVQFFAWIGWFPFLFYITTYVGEIYASPIFEQNPDLSPEEVEKVWEKGTRVGTFALLIFAITSFLSNMFLPFIVAPSYSTTTQTTSNLPARTPSGLARFLERLQIRWLTLRRAWLLSHILFTLCMWSTLFISTPNGAIALVGWIGIPWALTTWAPFALISAEISKRDAIRRGQLRTRNAADATAVLEGDAEDQAGVVLGIHNVAIAAPQVIATLVSSAIFKALQKPRGASGDDSVAWVLRFGGVAALIAAWVTTRVEDDSAVVKVAEPAAARDQE